MSPADMQALMEVAGPLFGESRMLEQMTSENTVVGGHRQDGSMKIRGALEQAQNLVRAQLPPPPQYVPPEYIQEAHVVPISPTFPASPNNYPPVLPHTIGIFPPVHPDDGQMMLSFDQSTQKVTNDLLREISKKLTKIIGFLEEKDTIPKQKSNAKPQV